MYKFNSLTLVAILYALSAQSLLAQKTINSSGTDIAFKISVPLDFKGRVVSNSLRKSEIEALLDLPVRNGDGDPKHRYGVEMTRPNYERFTASTCRQWHKAQEEDAYAATTFDMAMESSFIHVCGLLFELQRAKQPIKSLVANTRVRLADLNLLPAEMLVADTDDEEAVKQHLRGLTVSKAVDPKDIQKEDTKGITLSYEGMRQSFWEAARADFDGDGYEDILVFAQFHVEDGTLGYSDYLLLTRTVPSGPLKLIEARKSKHIGQPQR